MSYTQVSWHDNYRAWKDNCKQELREKGYSMQEINDCDICEDGSVYFGNLSQTQKNFVTSWEDSAHFID